MYFGPVRFLLEDPAYAGGDHSLTTSVWTKAGCRTYGPFAQNGSRHSLLSKCLFLLPDQCQYIVKNVCISDTVQTVYELPLVPNNTAVKHIDANQSGAKC